MGAITKKMERSAIFPIYYLYPVLLYDYTSVKCPLFLPFALSYHDI